MDQVLAKVKGRAKKTTFKLLSDCNLYENITVGTASCVTYDPDHNLDEDAWFKIEHFREQPYCIELLKKEFDSKEYDELTKDQFSKIVYLCAVQGDNFYFQKITPSLFVRKKRMISLGEFAQVEEDNDRLIVNSQPDAVYIKASDSLIFRNLATITSIFNGIDVLYKEATKEEVEQFLAKPFIEISKEYGVEKVSKPNRKRVALAMDTLAGMSEQARTDILSYIDSYCGQIVKFDKENNKFEINTDNDLKLLLYGIEQRFYTTPVGEEKRLANSVQPLS